MDKEICRLCELSPGTSGIIYKLPEELSLRRDLISIGIIPGNRITRELVSPCGDPSAYYIRDSLFSVRNSSAEKVIVMITEKDH